MSLRNVLRKSMLTGSLLLIISVVMGLAAYGQKSLIITHDDPFSNPNLPPPPDTLTTYAVQPDGSLQFIGSFVTGTNGGAGSGDANGGGISFIATRKIAVSGDNKFVYASAAPTNSISAFAIDGNTGLLTLLLGSPFPTGTEACNGIGLAASPNGKALYAFSACGLAGPVPGGTPVVSAFSIGADGSLTKVGADLPIAQPLDMAVSPDGRFLIISTLSNSGVPAATTIFNIAADGSLTLAPGSPFTVLTHGTSSTTQIDCSNHVFHGVDDLTSLVEVFTLATDGTLTQIAGSPFVVIPQLPGSGGLVGSTLVGNGKTLVLADLFGLAVSFSVAPDGTLTSVGGPLTATGQSLLGQMTADSSGTFVYSRGVNGIAAFAVDANGTLSNVPTSPLPSGNFAALGSIASYPAHSCAQPRATVDFGAIAVELEENVTRAPHSFELHGSFTLGGKSNGIAPLAEDVTVVVGQYTATIAAGSFKQGKQGLNRSFTFSGTINGVNVRMSIKPSPTKNQYSFEFESAFDLSGSPSPVPVRLTIGDDTGTASVQPEVK